MPTVTISMSEKAYDVYRQWNKGLRSQRMSVALLEWHYKMQSSEAYEVKE